MLSVITPVNVCLPGGAAASAAMARRLTDKGFTAGPPPDLHAGRNFKLPLYYSPGVMRCAVVVPAFMIQTPPDLLSLGNPSEAVVAPGTAIVMWFRVCSASAPIT